MGRETNLFREMGYSDDMGADKRGSISGAFHSKAPMTDVDRNETSLTTYGVHGKAARGTSAFGKRHGKRHHKKRK
jgi:hypothetical protein